MVSTAKQERTSPKPRSDLDGKRRRGAQPGNRNSRIHGKRSKSAVLNLRLLRAQLKALAHIGAALKMFGKQRIRQRPLRLDQFEVILQHDPRMALVLLQYSGLDAFMPRRS